MKQTNYTTKTIISLFILLILVIGALWLKSGGKNESAEAARISTGSSEGTFLLSPSRYDFGPTSMQRGKIEHDFVLKNDGASEIIIVRTMTSCMCTVADLIFPSGEKLGPFGMPGHGFIPEINAKVKSGETITVRVTFDPAAHGPSGIGVIERQVILDLGLQGKSTLGFRANVTP